MRLSSLLSALGAALLLVAAHPTRPATAQNIFPTNTPTPSTPVPLRADAASSPPPAVRLEGLSPVYQQLNRCSAAALTIQLSYFDWEGDYTATINGLNPNIEDVAVRLDEMTAFARAQGLGAIDRLGGTASLLKALIAAGFPVLIENVYYEGEGGFDAWLAHNRVIMGYDDEAGEFYAYDSLLGNGNDNRGRPIPYAEIDDRWRAFNHDYLVLYRTQDEALVQAILGVDWDAAANAANAYEMALAEADTDAADGFTYFNIGTALNVLGRYDEAAAAFDEAFTRGLPWRMLWYQYGPLEAYTQVGRYDDVMAKANTVLATTPGVEEMYYYLGLAYEGEGNLDRAQGYFEAALRRNRFYEAASLALEQVSGTPAPALSTAIPTPLPPPAILPTNTPSLQNSRPSA